MADSLATSDSSWIVENWTPCATPCVSSGPHGLERDDDDSLQADIVLQVITQMLECAEADEAVRLLANRLQQALGCRQVAVGLCDRQQRRCQVCALSGVVRFDSHTRFVTGIQNAVDETLAQRAECEWPRRGGPEQPNAWAHEKLLEVLGAECVSSIPLHDSNGMIRGVVLFVDKPAASVLALMQPYAAALAACLAHMERQHLGPVVRRLRKWRQAAATWHGRAVVLAVMLLAAAMIVPWPYNVKGDCLVQPVVRRYVAAPYDGTLAKALAAPGDVVEAGDVLARMDPREIQWELAELEADYARASKERDAAMATGQTSTAQLAELEMQRLDVQMTQLEHRTENLAIRSPIGGIVVAGDLEKAEGAPLKIGQTLYEIAPLCDMSVEVNVPEADITYVQQGMPVLVHLEAFPGEQIVGKVQRIHPQAELRDKDNVFVTQFQLANPEQRLRPGMNGWAQINSRKRSLGWILFHKPYTSLRRMFAW